MNIPPNRPFSPSRHQCAMTLVEVMVTSAIFCLAMAGFLAIHIFALKYDQTIKLKLLASNDARRVLNLVAQDVRRAGSVRVGHGDAERFTEATFGSPQIGNAIEVYPDKHNTNRFIRYYCDADDELLKRADADGAEVILARSVTNTAVFASEDGFGNVLSNNFNNRVIAVNLQFYQAPGDRKDGGGFLYDYYQIRNKVARRALE